VRRGHPSGRTRRVLAEKLARYDVVPVGHDDSTFVRIHSIHRDGRYVLVTVYGEDEKPEKEPSIAYLAGRYVEGVRRAERSVRFGRSRREAG
jgi:hypothetical protein